MLMLSWTLIPKAGFLMVRNNWDEVQGKGVLNPALLNSSVGIGRKHEQ